MDCSVSRLVGKTSLELSPLGLGVAPLGNLYTQVSDADADATLSAAVRHGLRWFDVAPLYGFGLAEERLGRFLKTASKDCIVSTKVGRVLEPGANAPAHDQFIAPSPFQPVFDYSAAGIERSYEDSLRRLKLDRVQLLLLHDVDRATHGDSHRALVKQLLDESLPTLHRLKAEGRVEAIGLGVNHWDIGFEVLASADIDCILLAGRYTLLDQTAFTSGFLDACGRRGVSVLAGGVFNSGFLSGGATYDYRPATESLIERRAQLSTLCERHRVTLPAAALQFAASHPAVTSLTVGARSEQEIKELLEAWHAKIPADFWLELQDTSFIPQEISMRPAIGAITKRPHLALK